MDIIKKLLKIDRWLFLGDKDQAHILIQSLIKELNDDKRTIPGRDKEKN